MTFAVRPDPRSATRLPLVSLLGWALVLVVACTRGEGAETEAPRGMVAELARAVGPAPTLGPRLSIAREPSRCASEAGCRETGTPSRRVNTVAARASQAARASVAPDALHASALFDLLWADDEGTSLRRSIQYLQTAARLDPRPAPILADLSAAHLVRAERANSPRDLLEAVETAERALQKDPANRAALFNRSLGLERFGLMGEAGRSWRAYLAADSTSDWADAARKRLAEVSRVPALSKAPSANATDAELAAYAVADPQGARTMGWDHLLGEWGAAVLADDAAKAADRLHRAEVLGNALERAGRDATLADAVRAIRAHAASEGVSRRLATAHRAFARGRVNFQDGDYPGAATHFITANGGARLSPSLKAWVTVFRAGTLLLSGRPKDAEAIFRTEVAAADPDRHPSLAGRLRLGLATMLLRTDRYGDALAEAGIAADLLSRAGEREFEGSAWGAAADAVFSMGDPVGGYSRIRRAIERLRVYPGAVSLHNVLFTVSEHAVADGYLQAAVHTQSEGVDVATRNGRVLYITEATLARARILASAGDLEGASRDVEKGRALVGSIAELNARAWFDADLRLAQAELSWRDQPHRASAAFDSAIEYFQTAGAAIRVFPALVGRARAKMARNDIDGATADLERAVAILDNRRNAVGDDFQRAALVESAREVFAQAAMLKIKSGDGAEALRLFDLGRPSLASPGRRKSDTPLIAPEGEVVLSYGLVGDTLLIWSLAGRDLSVWRGTLDAAELARTVEMVRTALELPSDGKSVRDGLERLYDWLIRPVESRLGRAETPLVVIPDGVLSAVPFAALYERSTRQYFVERHSLRFAMSLRDARSARTFRRGEENVLIVADPAFDPDHHSSLERLPGATAEAHEVAGRYTRTSVLAGGNATAAAVSDRLPTATLVHYAGHAVFDDDRPERSSLLLAPQSGREVVGGLAATALAKLDLRQTRLIVLSTCQSIRSGTKNAGGFAGLSGALQSAGVGGVVGSLWRVDDAYTRALMSEFYEAYRASGDAAGALHAAQLRLLRAPDHALRSPAAWAGFRYAGYARS